MPGASPTRAGSSTRDRSLADHEPLIRDRDAPVMTIVARRGHPVAEPRPRLLRFERPSPGDALATTIGVVPPEPDPRHELAHLALDLVVRTSEPADLPRRWTTYPFGHEVERTRGQLAPILSRSALLESFSREAPIAATRGSVEAGLPAGPIRVAYALRWLELGDGRSRPAWASIVAGPVELVSGALAGAMAGAMAAAAPRAGRLDQRKGEIST
jgi:hypothetical protein